MNSSDPMIMRVCPQCKLDKPRSEYYPKKNQSAPPRGNCLSCLRTYYSDRWKTKPEVRERVREFNRSDAGKAAFKRYRESEKGKSTQKRFTTNNPGKRASYVVRHYKKYPAKLAAMKEANRKRRAALYHADPETAKRLAAESLKRHPETKRSIDHRRRRKKFAAEGSHSKNDLEQIWQRQGGRCLTCGQNCWRRIKPADANHQRKWTIDHIKPISRGGSDWPANLRGLCLSCNAAKKDREDLRVEPPYAEFNRQTRCSDRDRFA